MINKTHGSLFSGIGGFDLGALRAGFTNVYSVEKDRYCNDYLKEHFTHERQFYDINGLTGVPYTTVISAGSPCQDISVAKNDGSNAGVFGVQSQLIWEAIRIVDEVRPYFFVLENSNSILKRGFHFVLAAFAKIGYICEWMCLRASDFGYPHKRERLYLIVYPISIGLEGMVFQPIETIRLLSEWTPTEAYLRCTKRRLELDRDCEFICPHDGFPDAKRKIRGYGNAVMPPITEYLFRCIGQAIDYMNNNLKGF